MRRFLNLPLGSVLLFLCLFACIFVACKQAADSSQVPKQPEQGIDELLNNLQAMKSEASIPLQSMQDHYQQLNQATNQFQQTEEEIRKDLLSVVKKAEQQEFKQELETIFNVGREKGFFLRQIDLCQHKIDLAVVGIGIIRVHQVLRGENASVKPQDTQEFIRYIKEQVQNALISEDKNYKAIVFKGIESSA